MKIVFGSLLLAVCLLSCSNPVKDSVPLKYNEIHHKVCKSDTLQQYELYVPTGKEGQKLPVIFVFDPHGDGRFAVSHFQEAAERFSYIIVGSDNSKNGAPDIEYILKTLVNEVQTSLPIDVSRIYAAGFSGGGRVAGMMAAYFSNVKGIITCGAGFSPQSSSGFEVYLVAGKEDFNYFEVVSSYQQLSSANWLCNASYFNGGHNWPNKSELSKAILWFQFNAMKKRVIPEDKDMIEAQLDSFLQHTEELMDKKQMLDAESECLKGIAFLNILTKTRKLENKLEEIRQSAEYASEQQKELEIKDLEEKLRNGYLQAFNSQNISWWQNEIKILRQNTDNEKNIPMMQMLKRMNGFLGIVCYSYTSRAAAENNLPALQKLIGIYELVEPQNADCFFYKAVLFDKQKNSAEARKAYAKAVELGFKDIGKAKSLIKNTSL